MQVKASCTSSIEKKYEMANAILIYKEFANHPVFASVHDVSKNENGTPIIKAGVPVSKKGLVKMLKALTPKQEEEPSLLGNNILAKGSDYLVWFTKPQKRQVFFKCKEFDGEKSALTDHPGLIFMIGKGKWYVFATKTSARPAANTPLYVAPYFNVWKGGHICTGNIETPKGKMKFNTTAWEEAFFRSYFTHPNQHEKGALTTFRGGIFALWKALMKGRSFPKETLVPEGKNLGEMFERVVKHG